MAASAVVVLEEEDDAKGLVRRGGSKPGKAQHTDKGLKVTNA